MRKVFLYLYPIREFTKQCLFPRSYYLEKNREYPIDVLNACIKRRYRDNGYEIIYVLYPDRKIFGLNKLANDQVIYTEYSFVKVTSDGIYPSEDKVLDQLGNVDKLVIGGFHFSDCVRRMGEVALKRGINTSIDLDLTDLFYSLYYHKEYFNINEYDPNKYKEYWYQKLGTYNVDKEILDEQFKVIYDSPVYGFSEGLHR